MGKRFRFGANWNKFLAQVTEDRIAEAERSLCDMLEPIILRGRTFLDVGSGSGLFSLAAWRLGAATVHSFDYDPDSVGATAALKAMHASDAKTWIVGGGDVLDQKFLDGLGEYDVVYSWGVLHHTGAMWKALENVTRLVKKEGILFVALYNDQGLLSRYWKGVKWFYNSVPRPFQVLLNVATYIMPHY